MVGLGDTIPLVMTDKTKQEIARRLKDYRLKSGLSQAALAKKAGLEPNTVARLERGLHRPSNPTIEKLAKALNVTASDLLAF